MIRVRLCHEATTTALEALQIKRLLPVPPRANNLEHFRLLTLPPFFADECGTGCCCCGTLPTKNLTVIFKKIHLERFLVAVVVLLAALPALGQYAQKVHKYLLEGDRAWKAGQYDQAEEYYRRALEMEPLAKAEYNLANAIYRQERYGEAIAHYRRAIEQSSDPSLKARALYNLGNSYFMTEDLRQSIEAYKAALRLDPNNEAAKNNLALALRLLKQQQQSQPRQGDQQESQNQIDEEQSKQQPTGQQQQPSTEQQPEGGQQQQDQHPESQQSNASPTSKQLGQQELEQLLRIMEQEERKVRQRLQKLRSSAPPSGKIW